jgi:hypothetical protein
VCLWFSVSFQVAEFPILPQEWLRTKSSQSLPPNVGSSARSYPSALMRRTKEQEQEQEQEQEEQEEEQYSRLHGQEVCRCLS